MTPSSQARPLRCVAAATALALAGVTTAVTAAPTANASLTTTARLGSLAVGGAETVTFHPGTARLFTTDATAVAVHVALLDSAGVPTLETTISLASYGSGVTSVALHGDLLAVGVVAATSTNPGTVVFIRATDLAIVATRTVGALPDAVTFTPDGSAVLVANEGEPNSTYTVDPEGSVSIIPITNGVPGSPVTVGFVGYNAQIATLRAAGVRIFGPNATVAQDFEPEYITVSADSRTAYVTLQENNALAVIDIPSATVAQILPLGTKDHSLSGNGLDAADREVNSSTGTPGNIQNWPVRGMYLPDQAVWVGGYIITANEGDARDYGQAFAEEKRIKDITLDTTAFPTWATLRTDANAGRLTISTVGGDTDADTDYDVLYSYGTRSITVWSPSGTVVWDSGDQIEQQVFALAPSSWDDTRSDNKGPEPEGITVGTVGDRTYVFVALERTNGIMSWDVTDPTAPTFAGLLQPPTGTDVSPEGMVFIPASQSPNRRPLLVVANEVSNTLAVWAVGPVVPAPVIGVAYTG
ncbi:MAG: alkaline phosphatase [Actinobacteria bacterium]|nr:alkaline phosphatase [Actinomycetota bacterium]